MNTNNENNAIGDQVVVSICCLSFNHSNYIRECLDGFMMQKTDFAFEVLIYDDASTDKTPDILREYELKYPDIIKPIYQTENQYSKGVGVTRKFNFSRAKGKYIAMCEGDDYWTDPLKLQNQVNFLDENEDFVLCCHNAKIIDDNGKLIQNKKLPELSSDKVYTELELQKGAFILTLSLMFRNLSRFREYAEDSVRVLNGDTFLVSLLGKYGKGYYMESIDPAAYREHGGGVWSARRHDAVFAANNQIQLFEVLRNLHSENDSIVNYFNAQISNCYESLLVNIDKVKFKEMINVNYEYIKRHNLLTNNSILRLVKYNAKFFFCKIKNSKIFFLKF